MDGCDVSVVTLTWNGERYADKMLRTLFADADESGVRIEVIVIDNGSQDSTLSIVRRHQEQQGPRLKLVSLLRNHGTTMPRNIGIRMATGRFVFILDSDTELRAGTLRGLLAAADELGPVERIGLIHPRLVFPDGEFQESARRFPTVLTKLYRLFGWEEQRRADESISEVMAGEVTTVDYAISAAWFVPRHTFELVGYLDERIFYAPEDVQFCARCWQSGLKIFYYPKVTVIHDCQRITNKKPLSRMGLSHAKELARFWWEYNLFFSRPDRE